MRNLVPERFPTVLLFLVVVLCVLCLVMMFIRCGYVYVVVCMGPLWPCLLGFSFSFVASLGLPLWACLCFLVCCVCCVWWWYSFVVEGVYVVVDEPLWACLLGFSFSFIASLGLPLWAFFAVNNSFTER